jgi:hypothetical protein
VTVASQGAVGGDAGDVRQRRVQVAEEATHNDGQCRSAAP